MSWWSIVPDATEHVQIARHFSRRIPRGRIRFLANDDLEYRISRDLELPGVLCNHNCFVDETIFRPTASAIEFNSVYNAAFHRYKRHYLAREIDPLLLIGYSFRGSGAESDEVIRSLPSATLANTQADGTILPLPAHEISSWLCKAQTGLCLSAVEGAMYASMEYLMSGLPVVSTLSLGGRDYFFDDDFVRIAGPRSLEGKCLCK
jgi:hypothetical protein